MTWSAWPTWLNPGDNAWQMTAATFVGLMSLPGLAVLYGGVMQKRWSVNSMMLTFVAFCLVLVAWCLWAFKMGFGHPIAHSGSGVFGTKGFLGTFLGEPGSVLGANALERQAEIPSITTGPPFHFPQSTLVYFQFVFAAITPILMLGSVLGRINFKAWIPFVLLWITCVYSVNAFLIWGGGYWSAHGALDYSGGYVIHLAAGISGFVAAAVIGPRLQRDREVDAPNNLLMVAAGAGLLWLGWNGFNGGDSYYAGANASAAVLNTNLCTAVAMLVWITWDYIFRDKPSLIGSVNGMITGLVCITPAAGFVNGYGAIVIGVVGSSVVWMAIRFLSRAPIFRHVDDTLGVIYTHGIAGLVGGLMVGVLADPKVIEYIGEKGASNLPGLSGVVHGSWTLLRWQAETAGWVILFSGAMTFLLLKLVGIFLPLRLSDEELEIGDHAIHGNEVYPSDVPTLGGPHAAGWSPAPAGAGA
ncbi:MAG: ammonium transporter, Amt family [Solirubrobacteraceae bacterium]|jgi:Amt family ammonium transporter|nr:ammonium transporter, Amt family [Solirubrobacteraceae bacterium]